MIVRIVTVQIKPGYEQAFEDATVANHRGSVREPGVLRFDVLKDGSARGRYYIYEVYRDDEATVAHKETEHYQVWRDTIADYMEGDRSSAKCSVVAPRDEMAW